MTTDDQSSLVTLNEHLSQYKNLEIASVDDNQDILYFLKNIPMESSAVSLKYDRAPDFFTLLKAQGTHAYVIKILNKDRSIGGIGVFTLRKAWVNGRSGVVAYTSDLRISPVLSNRSRVDWRNGYTSIIKEFKKIIEFKDVDYFHTAILDDNTQALRSLRNPKSKFIYEQICPYRSISLYGRLPFKSYKSKYQIETNIDKSEIELFLEQSNKNKTAGQYFKQDHCDSEMRRRENSLQGYGANKYMAIKDDHENIIACAVPTHTQSMRKIVIDKMNWRYTLLSYLTPLLRGKRLKVGQGLKILYISDLCFSSNINDQEKSNIINTFINYIYKNNLNETFHLITFLDQYNQTLLSTLRKNGHFFETKEGTLFQVSHVDHGDEYTKLKPCEDMSFELALS